MEETKVATNGSSTPITAKQYSEAVNLITIDEAHKLLGIKPDHNIETLLKSFEILVDCKIENHETKDLRSLTDAKNILLRKQVENQIEETGRFDLSGLVPFKDICKNCHGAGELYQFFRRSVEEDCRFCEGKKTITKTCKDCKGTGRYVKNDTDLKINVECRSCDKDPETGKPLGTKTEKCRACRGKGKFRKMRIAPKIEDTTHCRPCKGRGWKFVAPERQPQPEREKNPLNPVLSADLASKIKTTMVEG